MVTGGCVFIVSSVGISGVMGFASVATGFSGIHFSEIYSAGSVSVELVLPGSVSVSAAMASGAAPLFGAVRDFFPAGFFPEAFREAEPAWRNS